MPASETPGRRTSARKHAERCHDGQDEISPGRSIVFTDDVENQHINWE
jgi:hypothetical protein